MTASEPAEDPSLRAQVLAHIAATGCGYKAASRVFGVPRSTIQSWVHAERAAAKPEPKGKPPRAPAPARARARPPAPPAEAEVEEEPWDPQDCTREVWLRRGMVRAMRRSEVEIRKGHGGTAVRWEALAGKYRDELDDLIEQQRLAGLAPAPVDLVAMSREHAELLPALVRMDPERWEPPLIVAVVEMAKYRGGIWAQFAERLKGGG